MILPRRDTGMGRDDILLELMIAQIDPMVWYVHFGEVPPWEARCTDCADHREGVCKGGREPVGCMKGIGEPEMSSHPRSKDRSI
jgi:hypothetical protein